MPAVAEEPGDEERLCDILAGRDPLLLVLLEVPLLVVGDVLSDQEDEEQPGSQKVEPAQRCVAELPRPGVPAR